MDDLIRRSATGNSNEFADKLGISRSVLMENLRELRQLGAEIDYNYQRQSYFYTREFKLVIGSGRSLERELFGGVNHGIHSTNHAFVLYNRTVL